VSHGAPEGTSRLAARRAARRAEAEADAEAETAIGPGGAGGAGPPPWTDELPAGAAPDRRRWWRRGPLWVRIGAVLGLVVVASLLAPAPLVDPFVNRVGTRYQGECAVFRGVDIGSGSWPAVLRAATGQLRDMTAHTDEVRFDNDFTIYDVDFSADEVNVPPVRFGLVDGDAEIRGGESSATVRLDDVERILAGWGVTVDLHGGGSSLVADVQVPFVGPVPTNVEMVPLDGDLELRFAALDVIPLPSLVIAFPEPVALQGVDVRGDGMRVTTTVEGTMTSDQWGCDTSATQGGQAG
jgi:LmeA-like phospholipid-binding